MTKQKIQEYTLVFESASDLSGGKMAAKRDAGIVRVFQGDKLTDEAWVVVSRAGIVRLERIK